MYNNQTGMPKKTLLRKINGDKCEAVAMEVYDCVNCRSPLINKNKEVINMPGYDLECSNEHCKYVYQVKGYDCLKNSTQFNMSTGILKQAGKYKIMRKTSSDYKLCYIIIFYDNRNKMWKVVNSIITQAITPTTTVNSYGINKSNPCCRIKFDIFYSRDYVYTPKRNCLKIRETCYCV
jgi:hypothetical protein